MSRDAFPSRKVIRKKVVARGGRNGEEQVQQSVERKKTRRARKRLFFPPPRHTFSSIDGRRRCSLSPLRQRAVSVVFSFDPF